MYVTIIYSKHICAHIANIYIYITIVYFNFVKKPQQQQKIVKKEIETSIDVTKESQLYYIYTYAILNQ